MQEEHKNNKRKNYIFWKLVFIFLFFLWKEKFWWAWKIQKSSFTSTLGEFFWLKKRQNVITGMKLVEKTPTEIVKLKIVSYWCSRNQIQLIYCVQIVFSRKVRGNLLHFRSIWFHICWLNFGNVVYFESKCEYQPLIYGRIKVNYWTPITKHSKVFALACCWSFFVDFLC